MLRTGTVLLHDVADDVEINALVPYFLRKLPLKRVLDGRMDVCDRALQFAGDFLHVEVWLAPFRNI